MEQTKKDMQKLYDRMRASKIDEIEFSFDGQDLGQLEWCKREGKVVYKTYDYDNDFYLDPLMEAIEEIFLSMNIDPNDERAPRYQNGRIGIYLKNGKMEVELSHSVTQVAKQTYIPKEEEA